jgi:hypothetical protein
MYRQTSETLTLACASFLCGTVKPGLQILQESPTVIIASYPFASGAIEEIRRNSEGATGSVL